MNSRELDQAEKLDEAIDLEEAPVQVLEGSSVLVVDDDDRIIDVFSQILSLDAYTVHVAHDADSALEVVKTKDVDVVVLDVMLPGRSGIDVCQAVKNDIRTRHIPVILVTGDNARAQRIEGFQARADDFLGKPVDPLELRARVKSLIRTKRLYDEVEANRRDLEDKVRQRTEELAAAFERLQELDRVKSNIISVVSHELRTPLHQARSALQLFSDTQIPAAQRDELIQTATQAIDILEYRIEDIGVFSDPSHLKLVPVSARDLIMGAVLRVERLHAQEADQITKAISENLPAVKVDPDPVSRALVHLIDNAVKFGLGRGVRVEAHAASDGVRVAIRDNGPGIAENVRSNLFLPLHPGDSSSTRQHRGLGIGLALVKVILDAHGISLEIDSQPGTGTVVSFVLPRAIL